MPAFIALALVLIIAQPRLGAVLRRHRGHAHGRVGVGAWLAVFATGVYGGYFGAAQGIMLLAFLGLAFDEALQRLNAVKNIPSPGCCSFWPSPRPGTSSRASRT